LILADAKKPITAKALDAIVTASGNKADKSWATLLEKSFACNKIKKNFFFSFLEETLVEIF
jgi:ribosomal protein L12E/L44/L45/RPP1/RPP2